MLLSKTEYKYSLTLLDFYLPFMLYDISTFIFIDEHGESIYTQTTCFKLMIYISFYLLH